MFEQIAANFGMGSITIDAPVALFYFYILKSYTL